MIPTILIVEDEYLIARDLKNILKEEGYNVISDVDNFDYAVEILEKNTIDLVLLDINLKRDKDGIDFGTFLVERDTIPFIYISSYVDKITLDRVKDTRPYGFIVKPYKVVDIKTLVSITLNNFKHKNIDIIRNSENIIDDIPFVLKKVVRYVNEHIDEKIEVSELVNLTKWKSHYFSKVFTKYLKFTPYEYILYRKIEKAKGLITETEIAIRQISFNLGFLSHANFCKAFKKHTNITPDEYRKFYRIKQL